MNLDEHSKPYLSKRSVGFILGLAVFFFFIIIPTPELFVDNLKSSIGSAANDAEVYWVAAGMQKVLALFFLMIIWWITEALPIPATALLPAVMLPLLHVRGWADGRIFEFTFQKTLVSYANPVIALFFGCFLLAGAMQKWGVDKRITLWLLTRGKIAASPKLTLLALMYATALLSMWISNTAAAAIMLPIAIGILSQSNIEPGKNKFGTALMLCIAWSASVGGGRIFDRNAP
jgi:sodium-dependent dicarboxylate transporter 2/3/5